MVNCTLWQSASQDIRRPARQDKPPIAIAAIDKPTVINFQPDARMPQCGTTGNVRCAVARYPC